MTNRLIRLIAVVSVTLVLPACNRAADVDQEKKNVEQVFEKYLESVKTADLMLASQVWSQSQDVSAVTPIRPIQGLGGRLRGPLHQLLAEGLRRAEPATRQPRDHRLW